MGEFMNIEKLLFVDTETNPRTQEVECVIWKMGNEKGIIEEFDEKTFTFFRDKWHYSEGVIMFNAPFDLGVLSKAWEYNGFKWITTIRNDVKSSAWHMLLFGHKYMVKKIGFHNNLIMPFSRKHPIPVIDLLKLWSILVEQNDIGLKSLIKRHLGKTVIPWSEENARLEAYRYQDVDELKELLIVFLNKISEVEGLENYTAHNWGYIKTPATFTKLYYVKKYEELKEWSKYNEENVEKLGIKDGFEKAYHGGLTIAFYRGLRDKSAWVDIKGAYSKAIEVLNTDSYLKYDIEKVDKFDFVNPYLVYVRSNFILTEINGGLKMFYIHEPCDNWVWNFDIAAIKNMIPDFKYEVLRIYKIIPGLNIKKGLPVEWNIKKDIEEKENGRTTLYYFYKFLSNTSYGIKSQRHPYETIHTNMAIAGMITSKVHLILATINKTLRDEGYEVLYNDTDSSCFRFLETHAKDGYPFDITVIDRINKNIAPFEVSYEGVFASRILSLKRYISTTAGYEEEFDKVNKKIMGKIPDDKVRMHGKSSYYITFNEMANYAWAEWLEHDHTLSIRQFIGNTERGIKRIVSLFPEMEKEVRPFMFITDVYSDVMLSEFLKKWVKHIDSKLTVETKEPFKRKFRRFTNRNQALIKYKYSNTLHKPVYGDDMSSTFEMLDAFEETLNDESIRKMDEVSINMFKNPKYITPIYNCNECDIVIYPTKIYKGTNIKLITKFRRTLICDKCKAKIKEKTREKIRMLRKKQGKNTLCNSQKFCVKCKILLNPEWDGDTPNNISPSRYNSSKYMCNECRKKIRNVKK